MDLIVNTKTLNELSLLNTAISTAYSNYLKSAAESCSFSSEAQSMLNIYAAYCYLVEERDFSGLKILNDSHSLNAHFQSLVGFIYDIDNVTLTFRYRHCTRLKLLFHYIAQDKQLNFEHVTLSVTKISEDAKKCLLNWRQLEVDKTKVKYLKGWQVTSKEGREFDVHLDMLYVNFGADFTNKVYCALKNYASTQKSSTLKSSVSKFKSLFLGMCAVYNEGDKLTIETCLSRSHVQNFFHKVFKVLFVRSQAALNCPKDFHDRWRFIINIYTNCFINTKVFDEPFKPFIVPEWRDPKDAAPTFSVGGNTTKQENDRWFSNIPLKIKDESSVSIIQQRLNRDMGHIKHVCQVKFNELLDRQVRNQNFLSKGLVKPLNGHLDNLYCQTPVGAERLANTVATFYEHGIGAKSQYSSFLGFNANAKELYAELNLATPSTLSVLLTLLVIEHPLITPSWLSRWTLFDVNGNKVGYKKVGNQYIAVSYKARKREKNAQQDVILNSFSKSIVEFLIEHTQLARRYLKEKGDVNWRKMILVSSISNAHCPAELNSTLHCAKTFYQWLQDESLFDNSSDITLQDGQAISDMHSLRSVRRCRGLQIYLETRSMDAVAEALGHKKKNAQLLTSYLPKPLMDYFNERWVRQFQHAILLEAMKESVHCVDAVNMSFDDISEFLKNHGISDIPEPLSHSFNQQLESNEDHESIAFNKLTYTISTGLLQLLMTIRLIVESNDNNNHLLNIVNHWYQSAVFILDSLSSDKYSADTDLMKMFNIAMKNKLDTNLIRSALLC
nr:hypothetical protein [Vibrio metschnikovii]